MNVLDAIEGRRSIKNFTGREITRDEIQRLLRTVVVAPNHRMTEPWRFYVLGPEAREAYGRALGVRKAKRVEDPDAAKAVREKVAREHRAVPAMLAMAVVLDDDPEIREEDYAATFMGLENLLLAAHAMGLGTHVRSGAVMDDPAARDAVGVPEGERIVAMVRLGEPADVPDMKPRAEAAELTAWRP